MRDTERAFQASAAKRGIELKPGRALPWLTSRGHAEPLLAENLGEDGLRAMTSLFAALKGDEAALAAKAPRPLKPDFLCGNINQLIELDESQHFTSSRLRTLDYYDENYAAGFDFHEYRALCERLRATSDRDFAHREAPEFPGPNGRQRQRAYFDAVRDFGAPVFGHGAVIRVAAPERDPALAVRRLLREVK